MGKKFKWEEQKKMGKKEKEKGKRKEKKGEKSKNNGEKMEGKVYRKQKKKFMCFMMKSKHIFL